MFGVNERTTNEGQKLPTLTSQNFFKKIIVRETGNIFFTEEAL
jgi:hypothetical protein